MAVTRSEILALALAGVVALAMPLLALRGGAEQVEPAVAPALLAPPAPPTLGALAGRALFSGGSTPVAADIPLPADAPQLVGIVGRIGSDAVAMVRTGAGASRTLAVGESVDGWRLESLAIDAGYFTRGTERLRVPLPAG